MKYESVFYLAAGLLIASWFCIPPSTHAAKNGTLHIRIDGNAEHCSDLKVMSEGEIAQAAEIFALSRNEAPILEIQDTVGKSVIRVRGWDRPDYVVEASKIAAAEDRSSAQALD